VNLETSNLVYMLTLAYWRQSVRKKVWLRHVTHFKFLWPYLYLISMPTWSFNLSKWVHREIWSIAKGMTNHFHKRHVLFFAWTTIDWQKVCHAMLISEINNAVDGRRLLLAPMPVKVNIAIHHGWSFICLICCGICCKRFSWSLSLNMHTCANNKQLSVCAAMCYQPTLIALW